MQKLLPPMTDGDGDHIAFEENVISNENGMTDEGIGKRQNARTQINAALRDYVVAVQERVWAETFAIVRTVVKPRVNFIRGKGWLLLCPETGQTRFIGQNADEVCSYLNGRIAALRGQARE